MISLVSGAVVLLLIGSVFVMALPRGGRTHRFVGTEAEPYIAVALTAGVALAFTLLLSGLIELYGS
jgi:hypothetical protein